MKNDHEKQVKIEKLPQKIAQKKYARSNRIKSLQLSTNY